MQKATLVILAVAIMFLWCKKENRFETMRTIARRTLASLPPHVDTPSFPPILPSMMIHPNDKIFVSIASYRDPECKFTVASLIENASHPEKLVVVVCTQNHLGHPSEACTSMFPQVTIIELPSTEARGPTWARYLIQRHWRGEEFYLQIDSHTRFVKNWDTRLRKMLPSGRSCITAYPSIYDVRTNAPHDTTTVRGPMYIERISSIDGFPRYQADIRPPSNTMLESAAWSACFSFSSSQIILDAPYSPHTPFLFFGEETWITVKLLEKGWSFFTPGENIVFTSFDRSYRHTFWEHPHQKTFEILSRIKVFVEIGVLMPDDVPQELLKHLDISTRRQAITRQLVGS